MKRTQPSAGAAVDGHCSGTRAGPFPLVVGVTGHTDLVDDAMPPVRAQVRQVLARMRDSHPHTPLQVISALAEGADQLVAEEALALGIELAAVLPMPLPRYASTFESAAGCARLHALWQRAQLRIELPALDGTGPEEDAAVRYEHAGMVIARFSHVLLALWNGLGPWAPEAPAPDRDAQRGGTAHVAYLHATGGGDSRILGHSPLFPRSHTRLQPHRDGLTLRIATPRRKSEGCVGETGSLWWLDAAGVETEAGSFAAGAALSCHTAAHPSRRAVERAEDPSWLMAVGELAKIDGANALLAACARQHPAALAQSARWLLPEDAMATLGGQRPGLEAIRHAYAAADVFSQLNQRYLYRALLGIVLALPIAVLVFEMYAHHIGGHWMLFAYLAVIAGPVGFYLGVVKRHEWQNRFQDFRALAEALRVQLFWGLSGLPCSVTEFYLRKHHQEMDWIRQALLGPALRSLAVGLGNAHHELVMRHWIDDQFAYFSGSTERERPRAGKAEQNWKTFKRYESGTNWTYGTGIAIAAVLALMALVNYEIAHQPLHDGVVISMGLAPAVAAAFSIVAEKRAYRDHAHQYSRMGRLFGEAALLIRHRAQGPPREFLAIVRDLGAEALAENGDWLLHHRERQIEPIKGG
jgi:hypothetical protein